MAAPAGPLDAAEIARLEEQFFTCWPADETVEHEGWRMRATRGVSDRANSVYAAAWTGGDLDAAIGAAEGFYTARGLPATFMMMPVTQPKDLDGRLAARRYVRAKETRVCLGDPARVAALVAPDAVSIDLASDRGAEWAEAYARDANAADLAVRAEIMGRVPVPRLYVLAREGAAPVGLGMGVLRGDTAVVQGMRTLPDARGRGVGRAVLAAIGRWAVSMEAARMALQVEVENAAANALYAAAGFEEAYRYAYRVRR
ncbi:GNAT family N-acetyltransferase [Futiania mangrovi]|uniref:GNAT family N-acetyltransferase n=1 Tax=Futiania mangrovi TaxID=2959716 RepID=A0A9J6PAL1_9PROT|nr:GNAT family N-acetyltransferase [Futiania mangrovii]MCP1336117.1 GNAT family N-acetyltransferase [Futiania mangrovii]